MLTMRGRAGDEIPCVGGFTQTGGSQVDSTYLLRRHSETEGAEPKIPTCSPERNPFLLNKIAQIAVLVQVNVLQKSARK